MTKIANPIRLYRGGQEGVEPEVHQLKWGQVAVNYADKCLYILDVNQQVVKIASTESVLRSMLAVLKINGKLPDSDGQLSLLPQDIGEHGVAALTDENKVGKAFLENYVLTVNGVAADPDGNIDINPLDFGVPTLGDDGLIDPQFLKNYVLTINGLDADAEGLVTIGPEDIGEFGVPYLGPDRLVDPQFLPEDQKGLEYLGQWDAATNVPPLPLPQDVGTAYFEVSVAGTFAGTHYPVGSWIVSNGTSWGPVNLLQSVAGRTGIVVLDTEDIVSGVFDTARLGANPGASAVLVTDEQGDPTWAPRTDFGTVKSVGLSAPTEFEVSDSPVEGSGTIQLDWSEQAAATFLAGPTVGEASAPSFRGLANTDLPRIDEGEY